MTQYNFKVPITVWVPCTNTDGHITFDEPEIPDLEKIIPRSGPLNLGMGLAMKTGKENG